MNKNEEAGRRRNGKGSEGGSREKMEEEGRMKNGEDGRRENV